MDKLHQGIDFVLEVLAATAAAIHLFGLDKKPWAIRLLSVSNDLVGALKGKGGAQ